jgi:hypothetical protein
MSLHFQFSQYPPRETPSNETTPVVFEKLGCVTQKFKMEVSFAIDSIEKMEVGTLIVDEIAFIGVPVVTITFTLT